MRQPDAGQLTARQHPTPLPQLGQGVGEVLGYGLSVGEEVEDVLVVGAEGCAGHGRDRTGGMRQGDVPFDSTGLLDTDSPMPDTQVGTGTVRSGCL